MSESDFIRHDIPHPKDNIYVNDTIYLLPTFEHLKTKATQNNKIVRVALLYLNIKGYDIKFITLLCG